jgi:hypothetical protein
MTALVILTIVSAVIMLCGAVASMAMRAGVRFTDRECLWIVLTTFTASGVFGICFAILMLHAGGRL